jgi:hypothetical protein
MKSNPVGFVVVHMRDGHVTEFKLPKKGKPYDHMQSAINAVKKLRVGYQGGGEWVAMTTIRLAEVHRKEWESIA